MVHLLSQVEGQRLEALRKEEELTLANQRSSRDQEALLEVGTKVKILEAQLSEVQEQLERALESKKSLEEEKENLEERLNHFGEREGTGPLQADRQSVSGTVWHREPTDRTQDWVLQQKSGNTQSATSSTAPHEDTSPTGQPSGPHHGPWRTVDRIVAKLHLISSKIRSMASKATDK